MPTKAMKEFISSFYADDSSYAASDTSHGNRKTFAGEHLQIMLGQLLKVENWAECLQNQTPIIQPKQK